MSTFQAFILAAGLGTRLKPWTLSHPKALVPVGGIPMLQRVICRVRDAGASRIVVNVHHFADQIVEFLDANDFGIPVVISDETDLLLDTGGAIAHASNLFDPTLPVLVHNVDILSNADLNDAVRTHTMRGDEVTLLTSGRDSSRRLLFDAEGALRAWHHLSTDEYRPCRPADADALARHAFSGIYVLGNTAIERAKKYGTQIGSRKFPVMDWLLADCDSMRIREYFLTDLQLIDIGKPDTLRAADALF